MILLCISLTPACSACPGETITPLLLASGAANITSESWDVPGLAPTARTAHEQVHPCAHGHPGRLCVEGGAPFLYEYRQGEPKWEPDEFDSAMSYPMPETAPETYPLLPSDD